MTPADISRIRDLVSSLSASGRVIMLCSAPGDMCGRIMKGEFPDLTFLGIAEICDGVRKDAQSSVRDAQKAGIQVVMMTATVHRPPPPSPGNAVFSPRAACA